LRTLAATSQGSQWLTLVWSATSQCSALAASMARFTSAFLLGGQWDSEQRLFAGSATLSLVARYRADIAILGVAKQLGDIQRSGDHGHGAFQLASDGQQCAAGVEKQEKPRRRHRA
jgi:hypothetical protein